MLKFPTFPPPPLPTPSPPPPLEDLPSSCPNKRISLIWPTAAPRLPRPRFLRSSYRRPCPPPLPTTASVSSTPSVYPCRLTTRQKPSSPLSPVPPLIVDPPRNPVNRHHHSLNNNNNNNFLRGRRRTLPRPRPIISRRRRPRRDRWVPSFRTLR